MANFSTYKNLELPTSPEHYNIQVFNKNFMVIDSELHKLDIKNQSQDKLLVTKELLNSEITRATNKENDIIEDLASESARAKTAESMNSTNILNETTRAMEAEETIDVILQNHINDESKHHIHSNKNILDKLDESEDGNLMFNGQEINSGNGNSGNENNENSNNSFFNGVSTIINSSATVTSTKLYFSNLLKEYKEESSDKNDSVFSAIMKIEIYSNDVLEIYSDSGLIGSTGKKKYIDSYLYLCNHENEIYKNPSGYDRLRQKIVLKAIGENLNSQYGSIMPFSNYKNDCHSFSYADFGLICRPALGYYFKVDIIPFTNILN